MESAKVDHFEVYYYNVHEFRGLVKEIFREHQYYVELETEAPVILDVGAHIGVSTLFFKKQYPQAKIFAIEPLPENLELLRLNIEINHLEDVMVIPTGVAAQKGSHAFYADTSGDRWYSTASFHPHGWDGTQLNQESQVPTLTLNELIYAPIDLLKMDIEGAEQAVLEAAFHSLRQVKHLIFEFHPRPENNLPKLVEYLEQLGFKLTIYKNGFAKPLHKVRGLVLVDGHRIN